MKNIINNLGLRGKKNSTCTQVSVCVQEYVPWHLGTMLKKKVSKKKHFCLYKYLNVVTWILSMITTDLLKIGWHNLMAFR